MYDNYCYNFNPNVSDLVGQSQATLQQWLQDAQQARHQLMTGTKPVMVAYAQGDGSKTVTYNRADLANLTAYIAELKAQLGITTGSRRPISVYFR